MNFKYSLDRSSKKYRCPRCQKRTFVRYIDNVSKNYLEETMGRCDRESKCQYHTKPTHTGTLVDPDKVYVAPKPSFHINREILKHGRNFRDNNFIGYLKNYFSKEEIDYVILKYLIGTSDHWKGATIFWQIDQYSRICCGKVMLYDSNTGKRIKKPYPHINWIHKINRIPDFVLQQCLFGLHLINDCNTSTIAIVESEKTAIIMSILVPDYTWMATGSKSNLKRKTLLPIKGHNIVLFPDNTEFDSWSAKALQMAANGFKISCSRLLESSDLEDGDDLVDMLFKFRGESETREKRLTLKETSLNRLVEKNPILLKLVEEFGLV